MTMITPSYLGETIEYSSLHACRSTLEDPTKGYRYMWAMIDGAGGTSNTAVASAPQKPSDAAKPADAQKSNDANITTASLVPRPAPARVDHRLVMEIHVPGAPTEPLVWTRSQN